MTTDTRLEIMRRVKRIAALERKYMIYQSRENKMAVQTAKGELNKFLKEVQ